MERRRGRGAILGCGRAASASGDTQAADAVQGDSGVGGVQTADGGQGTTSTQAGSKAADTAAGAQTPPSGADTTQVNYVANTNSMKFHPPGCEAVSNIASGNRMDFTGTREELVAASYTPCGTCNP